MYNDLYSYNVFGQIPRPIVSVTKDGPMEKKKKKTEKLQIDIGKLGEWAKENGMKIDLGKSKAVNFMRTQVKDPLIYSLLDQVISEASSCKYLGIILRYELWNYILGELVTQFYNF